MERLEHPGFPRVALQKLEGRGNVPCAIPAHVARRQIAGVAEVQLYLESEQFKSVPGTASPGEVKV